MPGHSRSWSTFVWNFYLQPTFRSRVLVLTWANWLNCPYINNPNTLAGSRPLLTTPVTFPPSSCLPYLERKRQRQRQNNIHKLTGSRPLLTTPVTVPPSSCLPYLTFQSSAISNIFENTPTQELTFPFDPSHNKYFFSFFVFFLSTQIQDHHHHDGQHHHHHQLSFVCHNQLQLSVAVKWRLCKK